MPLVNCSDPACPGKVDTDLACQYVTALFGIKVMLEKQIESLSPEVAEEPVLQLKYVDDQLSKFRIQDMDQKFGLFKSRKMQDSIHLQPPQVQRLYIECTKGHRNFYEVECKP